VGRTRTTRRLPARGRFFSFIPEQQDDQIAWEGSLGSRERTHALSHCNSAHRTHGYRDGAGEGRGGGLGRGARDAAILQLRS
jgi:hypothetical protein